MLPVAVLLVAPAADAQEPARDTRSDASRFPLPASRGRDTLRIYAVGDINLGRGVTHEYLLKGDTLYPFLALADTLRGADLLFGNLESPIAPIGHPFERTGSPVFSAPPVAADALRAAGFDVVSTANNHAWDAGKAGVLETLSQLDRVAVAHAGTGKTRAEARAPAWLEARGWRVAVFALTRAFNPAPRNFWQHPGASHVAYADTSWLYPAIRGVKQRGEADLVIVSVHAGQEYTDTTDAPLLALFRGAVDAGADIVLGHHPHVLQRLEWRGGKPIARSLGNFIFMQRPDWTRLSAVFRFTVAPDGAITADLLPIRVGFQATLADGAAADSVYARVGLTAGAAAAALPPTGP
jgi:poly-gamma-glutamate synthesis protein (capsule biosynthesis protein)